MTPPAARATVNEFQIIEQQFRRHAITRDDVRLGIGDDAALLGVPAGAHVLGAQVTLVAEAGGQAEAFAGRLFARALARLACKNVTPCWATLALTVPHADTGWLQAFAGRLSADLARQRIALVGGDTTRGPTTATLAMHGHVRVLPSPLAATAGDRLWMADAADPLVAGRLQRLTWHRASVACDGDAAGAADRLASGNDLRLTWQAAPERTPPAGAVLIALPADEPPLMPGAFHVATLGRPADA